MEIKGFEFSRLPRVHFGSGAFAGIGRVMASFGRNILVVTGGRSLLASGRLDLLWKALRHESLAPFQVTASGEPSPESVDLAVAQCRGRDIQAVLAVGGGSVIDAGKAISAMLPGGGSVFDYLEGVGTGARHSGRKLPFVAVPTTAGTGSEATKNAVLSRTGPSGFKKSLRHENFIPDVAVIDPQLSLTCPAPLTAACGMDAFTQLLESYLSTKASPLTDALALSGIEAIGGSLVQACSDGAGDEKVRGRMAYGAFLSGVTLANAGLGLVHGLASAVGGVREIPHGVVCGTLMGAVNAATIRKLLDREGPGHPALRRFARVGALLGGVEWGSVAARCRLLVEEAEPEDLAAGCRLLTETLDRWTETLRMPRLGAFGVREADLDRIVAATDNKCHPLPLEPHEIREILLTRL